jgi:hypothetical protein
MTSHTLSSESENWESEHCGPGAKKRASRTPVLNGFELPFYNQGYKFDYLEDFKREEGSYMQQAETLIPSFFTKVRL